MEKKAFSWDDVVNLICREYGLERKEALDLCELVKKKDGIDRCIFIYRAFGMAQDEIATKLKTTQKSISLRLDRHFDDVREFLKTAETINQEHDRMQHNADPWSGNPWSGDYLSIRSYPMLEDDYSEESSP